MENFNINPCKACNLKCKADDINCINNCCSDTIAAFKGVSSINTIRNDPDFQNCVQCLNNSIQCLGSNTCDMRITAAPVWVQVPHYFPELLNKYKNINYAKNKCYEYCLDSKYKDSCIENCNYDAAAVEPYTSLPIQNKNNDTKPDDPTPKPDETPIYKTNPFSFYFSLFFGLFIFGFIIFIFLKILFY